ncbi:mechanosensitive ion channel domain-containing protein [Mucilaginibacter sp.]|uniref:mechanosensitive ion channel family protein n=1 Tax=Mucilaginibacter sp. TaxID=1882438 RepID=UPI0025DA5520|nr:mechanosensitive ion channel domain-containing protein [Mucilaginibacter sp.]
MRKIIKLTPLIIFLLADLFAGNALGQEKTKKQERSKRDAEKHRMRSRDSLLRTFNRADTSINAFLQRVEHYTSTFNQINNSLSEGLDTGDVSTGFPAVMRRINKIDSLTKTHKSSTLRYLAVLRDNLDHLQDKLTGWQDDLEAVSAKLIANQHELIKFDKDTSLNIVPYDSVIRSTYFEQRGITRHLYYVTDTTNRANLVKVNQLQDKVTVAFTRVMDATDQIDLKIRRFAARAFAGEADNILKPSLQVADFKTALKGTVRLNGILYNYFIKSDTTIHYICLFSLLIMLGWVFYVRRRTLRSIENPDEILGQANYIRRNPLVSALLVTVAIVPYFYDHPPVVFLETLFLVSMICTLILIKRHFLPETFNFLCGLFLLGIIYGASNLFIQITNIDRYVILLLSIISIISGWIIFKSAKKTSSDHIPHTCTALRIFIGLHIISLILNLTGRFSLAKIIGITAVFNLWFAVILFFVVQIIIQGLFLQFQVKKDSKSIIAYLDYALLQKKFRKVLITLATLLWLFFLLQNLNIDDWVADMVSDLLSQQRTVGGASFTFSGFVTFILVVWLSSIVSKVISYFYDVSSQRVSDLSIAKKKNQTSALLIRIGVFSLGFLLAVAASGFPLEKLTIIISAFGVGIGFGLQNIVNNLVSGIILAFEKPIQIGDLIEVDNKTGRMKEIGIRSSKIMTSDGAEVIIPNGDLISQHVINWTLSNNYRRIDLVINVAHGMDINKVENILRDIISTHAEVIQTPTPLIFIDKYSDESVDFKMLFWVIADNTKALLLKSDLMAKIYGAFDEKCVEIPSDKKDVNLRFPDGVPVLSIASKVQAGEKKKDTNKTDPGQAQ